MLWPFFPSNARIRAQPTELAKEARLAVVRALEIAGKLGKPDVALARWVLTESGDDLRGRWAQRLEEVVGEAVGPIWSKMDAAEEEDIAAAGGDGVVIDAFERFAFQAEELVNAVLDSPVLLPAFAAMVRTSIAKRTGELVNGGELYPLPSHPNVPHWATFLNGYHIGLLHQDTDHRENPGHAELAIIALWEWLGGYLAAPLPHPPGPEWSRVVRIDGGHRPDGSKAPDLWIHRPTGPARYLVTFAGSLWESEWRAVARRAYELSTRENALTVRTVEGVVGLLSSATIAHDNGETLALIDPDGERRGEIDLLSLRDLLQRSNSGGGVVTPEVVRATAEELIRARHTVAGVHAFTHAVQTVTTLVRGGHPLTSSWPKWKEWAEAVSDHAEVRLTPDLRRALYSVAWFGNLAQMRLFDGRFQRGFWTLSAPDPFQRGRRRRGESQVVDFSYSPVLSPEWACRENPGDRSRGVRLLYIPPRLPVGSRINPNQKAQAQLFTLLLLSRIAKHTDSRRVADGAVLTPDDLSQLARLAGLNLAYIDRQIDAMQDAGLIEQVTPTRFSLAGDKARQLAAYRKKPPRRRSRKGR